MISKMRKIFTIKNCLASALVLGCLTCILVLLLIFSGARKLFHSFTDNKLTNDTETHIEPKNKSILLKILLISDTENDWENFQKAVNLAKNENLAFIVHLGDVTQLGTLEDLSHAKNILDSSEIPYYVTAGDRDLWKASNSLAIFSDTFGMSYQFWESNGINFIMIDNSNEYLGIDDIQWQFIEETLPKSQFVFLHNPIFFKEDYIFGQKGMGEFSAEVDNQRSRLLSLIRDFSVKAVFAGDQHLFSVTADKEKESLYHYVAGAVVKDRNLEVPNLSVLTIYDDMDYYVKQIILAN